MPCSTVNSLFGLDVSIINQLQNKKRRQAENSKRYRQTLKGRLSVQKGIARSKERYTTDPEYRRHVLTIRKKPAKKDWRGVGITRFRTIMRKHGPPISIFCSGEKLIFVPDNLGDQREWRTWTINGQRMERTFDAMYEKFPDWFIGKYDANITAKELHEDIRFFIARCHLEKKKKIVPVESVMFCDNCDYNKQCAILGLTCPSYRRYVQQSSYSKYPKIPDRYLDGSKPGPEVI